MTESCLTFIDTFRPKTPTPFHVTAKDDGHLDREYVYLYQGQEIHLFTSASYLSLRFEPGFDTADVEAFLRGRGLRITTGPDRTYGLYVVGVSNTFSEAAALFANPEVIYVGPVFERMCGGLKFLQVVNQIIVQGDVADPTVETLLRGANAVLIGESTTVPGRYTYELPWDQAGPWFDLSVRLARLEAVVCAEPDFLLPCK